MNIGEAISDAVKRVAPTLARELVDAVPGGRVFREVSRAALGRPDASEDALAAALQNPDPDTLGALAALEREYTAQEGIHAGDRANARAMAIEMGDPFTKWFAIALGGMFFSLLILLSFVEPPPGSQSIVYGGFGTLGTAFVASVTYFFGSSIGSKIKDYLPRIGGGNR